MMKEIYTLCANSSMKQESIDLFSVGTAEIHNNTNLLNDECNIGEIAEIIEDICFGKKKERNVNGRIILLYNGFCQLC